LVPVKTQAEQRKYFADHYAILFARSLTERSPIERLGRKDPRVCRYCGKTTPAVTFRRIAHALPELIGNHWILAHDECDDCNTLFSNSVEDHLSKYVMSRRTLSQHEGKNGVPSYKDNEGLRVDVADGVLRIKHPEEKNLVDLNEAQIKLSMRSQPYIPIAVFKAFVKMAVAVMPQHELSNCAHLLAWIRNADHAADDIPMTPLFLHEQSIAGHPYSSLDICLLRRKDSVSNCPYLYFFVSFSHTRYQILVPMPEKDGHLVQSGFYFEPVPPPFGDRKQVPAIVCRLMDFQSTEKVRNRVENYALIGVSYAGGSTKEPL
jgi:hypothetical protein